MCNGIAVLVWEDPSGKIKGACSGVSSHDELAHTIPILSEGDLEPLRFELLYPQNLVFDRGHEVKTETGLFKEQPAEKYWIAAEEVSKKFNITHKKEQLQFAYLIGADLRGAYLTGANLTGANLIGANLRVADLRVADLTEANLTGADLIGANLRGADLTGANLIGANLRGANLRGANLRGADLTGANLTEADLRVADLTEANLTGADLRVADLTEANLTGAKYSTYTFFPTGIDTSKMIKV